MADSVVNKVEEPPRAQQLVEEAPPRPLLQEAVQEPLQTPLPQQVKGEGWAAIFLCRRRLPIERNAPRFFG